MRTLLIALSSLALGVAFLGWWISAEPTRSAEPARAYAVEAAAPAGPVERALESDSAPVVEAQASEERETLGPSAAERARNEREARERTRVIGRVMDSSGQPVPDVRVLYALAERGPEAPLDAKAWQAPERKLQETRSDAEGRFAIAPAPIGVLRLALRAREHAPRDIDGVAAASGRTTDLGEIELAPGLVLAGFVLSAEGAPVEGAWLIRPDSTSRAALGSAPGERGVILGQSGADGSFRLPPQPIGPWALLVHSPQHPDFVARSAERLAWNDESRLELRFPPGATIAGRVTIEPGPHAPRLADLEVRARALEESEGERADVQPSARHAKLGALGEFTLEGLPVDSLARVEVITAAEGPRGEEWTFQGAVDVRAGERDVELVVGAIASVTLSVRDALTGEKLSEVRARALARDASGNSRGVTMRSSTQADGSLLLRTDQPLDASVRVRLSVSAQGHFPAESVEFSLPSGANVELPELALEPRPKLEFRVTDASSGRPLAGARVLVCTGAGAVASVSSPPTRDGETTQFRSEPTDAHGHTQVWGERIDCGWAVARLEHYAASAPLEVCFRSATSPIEIALSKGPTLVVRVFESTGAPAPSRKVMLRRDGGVDVSRIEAQRYLELEGASDSEGVHRFEGLTPGAYRVALLEPRVGAPRSADEHTRTFATISLAPQGESQVDLRALPRGRLSGRVSLARTPLPNAVVTLTAPNSPHPRAWTREGALRTRTDAAGRYSFEELASGDWNLMVFHADLLTPSREALSYDGDERTFDIAFARTALVGRVVDKSGNPLEGARIAVGRWQPSARSRDRRASPFQRIEAAPIPLTGPDGRFTILGAPAERIAIEVRHPQHQRLETKPFTPQLGDERDLGDLVMAPAASVRVELARLVRSDPRPRVVLRRLDGPKNENGQREVRVLTSDSNGRTHARGLAPGKWRIEVDPRLEGRAKPHKDLQLQAHETRVVEFELH